MAFMLKFQFNHISEIRLFFNIPEDKMSVRSVSDSDLLRNICLRGCSGRDLSHTALSMKKNTYSKLRFVKNIRVHFHHEFKCSKLSFNVRNVFVHFSILANVGGKPRETAILVVIFQLQTYLY